MEKVRKEGKGGSSLQSRLHLSVDGLMWHSFKTKSSGSYTVENDFQGVN